MFIPTDPAPNDLQLIILAYHFRLLSSWDVRRHRAKENTSGPPLICRRGGKIL